jgi:hypothetical protein
MKCRVQNEDKREFRHMRICCDCRGGVPPPENTHNFSFLNLLKNILIIDLIVCNFRAFTREGEPLPYEN